jgi:hypothetical protein
MYGRTARQARSHGTIIIMGEGRQQQNNDERGPFQGGRASRGIVVDSIVVDSIVVDSLLCTLLAR